MQKNRYVDFVSDEDFLGCVMWVCDAYPEDTENVNLDYIKRNMVDPFKMVFDIINTDSDIETWAKAEQVRQQDKTINNRIGNFHQMLLGKVKGWTDLGIGSTLKVDLRKNDNSIFIELKNKYNTMNSDATDKCREKLEKAIAKYPNAKAYWAFIISKDGSSGDSVWYYHNKKDPRIRVLWGKRVYQLVTGDENALETVWNVLPLAISDALKIKLRLNDSEKKKLATFFEAAFHH
jgi:hypothetical protein